MLAPHSAARSALALLALPAAALAFLPFQNPPASFGPSNYNMSLATLSMFCNSSGPLNAVPAAFGVPSIDWSNEKAQWAAATPMDDNERLAAQAEAIKAANPLARVFTYRNLVKALPWFKEVREILVDPAYSGFFLAFRPNGSLANASYHVPACDTTYSPPLCSALYHDQSQVRAEALTGAAHGTHYVEAATDPYRKPAPTLNKPNTEPRRAVAVEPEPRRRLRRPLRLRRRSLR